MNILDACFLAKLTYSGWDSKTKEVDYGELIQRINFFIKDKGYILVNISSEKDILYFILEKDGTKYICIRGTQQKKGWMRNLRMSKYKLDNGKIHKGFYDMAVWIFNDCQKYISNDDKVQIIGHSQGGSASLILGNLFYENWNKDNTVNVWAFEPARIANKKYIKNTENYNINRIIVKNSIDVVCQVPPKFLNYSQYKEDVIYFDKDNNPLIDSNTISRLIDKINIIRKVSNWGKYLSEHDLSYLMDSITHEDNEEQIKQYFKRKIIANRKEFDNS